MADRTQTGARAAGGLTQRQEAFCLAFIESGNASEAYRRAYKPKRMSAKSIHEKASHILAEDKVQARVAELRAGAAEAAKFTLEQHLETLAALRDLAKAEKAWAPAIQAEVKRGEASGFYPDRGKVSVTFPLPTKGEPVSETAQWVADLTKQETR
jgi:phage terminase small subunit